jgi:hypothetical protein
MELSGKNLGYSSDELKPSFFGGQDSCPFIDPLEDAGSTF